MDFIEVLELCEIKTLALLKTKIERDDVFEFLQDIHFIWLEIKARSNFDYVYGVGRDKACSY